MRERGQEGEREARIINIPAPRRKRQRPIFFSSPLASPSISFQKPKGVKDPLIAAKSFPSQELCIVQSNPQHHVWLLFYGDGWSGVRVYTRGSIEVGKIYNKDGRRFMSKRAIEALRSTKYIVLQKKIDKHYDFLLTSF